MGCRGGGSCPHQSKGCRGVAHALAKQKQQVGQPLGGQGVARAGAALAPTGGAGGGVAHAPIKLRAAERGGSCPHPSKGCREGGSRPRPSKGCRWGSSLPCQSKEYRCCNSGPCQTKVTGGPTTRGAGCGRSSSSSSLHRQYRRGGSSCPHPTKGCRGGRLMPPPI